MSSSVWYSEVALNGERDVNRMEDEAKVDSQRGADGERKNDEEPRTTGSVEWVLPLPLKQAGPT